MNSTYLAYVSGMNFLKTETNLKLFLYFIFYYTVCVCTHAHTCRHAWTYTCMKYVCLQKPEECVGSPKL